jgi:hypothetical protein
LGIRRRRTESHERAGEREYPKYVHSPSVIVVDESRPSPVAKMYTERP